MYKAFVSSRYYVPEDGNLSCLSWAEEEEAFVCVASGENFEEVLQKLSEETSGSRWCLYPSSWIENEEEGEVWESTLVVNKCPCCGHTEYDRVEWCPSKLRRE